MISRIISWFFDALESIHDDDQGGIIMPDKNFEALIIAITIVLFALLFGLAVYATYLFAHTP